MTELQSGSQKSPSSTIPPKNGLTYTKWGLVALFGFLLLGDFCFQFMEAVLPKIMPLQLDAAGASNLLKAGVIGSTSAFFNLALNPLISFKSDAMRTSWGRRRPILLWMTPFVCLALACIAFAPEIAVELRSMGLDRFLSGGILPKDPTMASLVVILALGTIIFEIFNFLMLPVFHYLFVDVVPDAYMGRFMALFRMVATAAAYIFNAWVFPFALSHTREIYLGSALLYGIGFFVMILMVKEGDYPPPVHRKATPFLDKVRLYIRECYTHSHYLLFNARNAFFSLSMAADMFLVFYITRSLNISLKDVGQVGAMCSLALLLLLYPFGVLADRFKPLRVSFAVMIVCLPMGLIDFFLIADRSSYFILGFLTFVLKGLIANLNLPFYASIPPQDRYGQFGSANQIVISLVMIVGTMCAGWFMDVITCQGDCPALYRYCFIWSFVFFAISTGFMFLFYRSWCRCGGPDHYVPPVT